VPDEQLSLAIGKGGQNVRLAAKLTGWKIDVRSRKPAAQEGLEESPPTEKEEMEEKAAVAEEAAGAETVEVEPDKTSEQEAEAEGKETVNNVDKKTNKKNKK